MSKDNKTHIGFFLNLDRPSDRAINHILETIPSYVSKTSYIKRAIMFYKKHCNDDIEITDNGMNYDGENDLEERDIISKPVKQKPKSKDKAPSKTNKSEARLKTELEIVNPIKEAVAQKITNPEEEILSSNGLDAGVTEDNSNDIIVNNNSDIDSNVDYDEFVNGFFTS